MSKKRKVNPNKTDFTPKPLLPQTEKQDTYINSIKFDEITFAIGSAGTGKTFIPTVMAADMYIRGQVDKIILTRPTVECGEKLGALPGDLDEKMEPWMLPFLNIIKTRMSKGAFDCAVSKKNIEYVPFQYMRGLTFDGAFVICDEAQNATKEQIKMLTTRVGLDTKLVICGDTKQSDVKAGGLQWLVNAIRQYDMPVEVVEFSLNDCVRSDTCKMFLELYEKVA